MKKEKSKQRAAVSMHYTQEDHSNKNHNFPLKTEKTSFLYMRKIISISLLTIMFFSCAKVTNKPSWDVDAVLPLLNVSIRGADLVNDSNMVLNADQSLGIVLKDSIFAFNFDTVIPFPEEVFNGSIPFPFPDSTYFDPGEPIFDPPFAFDQLLLFENGIKVQTAKVESGQIAVEIFNNSGGDLVFDYTINSSSGENGEPLHITKNAPKQQTTGATIDLSGYTFDLTGLYQDTVNTIRNTISVVLAETEPEAVAFSLHDTLSIHITFENMVVEYAKGYFGQQEITLDDQSVDIDLFDNFQGTFQIPQAEVYLQAINEYGIDGNFNIAGFSATNSSTNESVSLEGAVLDSNFYFGSATETGQLKHLITRDTSVWDFSQSNILNLFGILPDKLHFSAHIQANTGGDSINLNNFFYRSSNLSLGLEAIINQGFSIQDMLVSDTLQAAIDTTRLKQIDSLQQPSLFLVVKNQFPLDMKLNIIFCDEEYAQTDTIVNQFSVEAPTTGDDGFSSDSTKNILEITLNEDFIEKLKKTKHIIYQSVLSSAGEDYVKIRSKDKLKIIMVLKTGYTINTADL